MSYYDDAARDQAANDSTVIQLIRQGQHHKAVQRITELVKAWGPVISSVAAVVSAVLTLIAERIKRGY